MDPTRAAWRVLDDGAAATRTVVGDATPEGATARAGPASERGPGLPWPLAGAAVVLALVLVGVAVVLVASGPEPVAVIEAGADRVAAVGSADPAASGAGSGEGDASAIVVHVAGAVRRPGLVTLLTGARVADAIEAAGGLDVRADAERVGRELNLAERVTDGQRVVVPSRDDVQSRTGPTGGSAAATPDAPALVDLNHADAATLDTLPGVGPVTAAKIIAAREERPFRSLEELVERKVVSASTLAKLRDRAVVR